MLPYLLSLAPCYSPAIAMRETSVSAQTVSVATEAVIPKAILGGSDQTVSVATEAVIPKAILGGSDQTVSVATGVMQISSSIPASLALLIICFGLGTLQKLNASDGYPSEQHKEHSADHSWGHKDPSNDSRHHLGSIAPDQDDHRFLGNPPKKSPDTRSFKGMGLLLAGQ